MTACSIPAPEWTRGFDSLHPLASRINTGFKAIQALRRTQTGTLPETFRTCLRKSADVVFFLLPVDADASQMHSCLVSKSKNPLANATEKKTHGTVIVEKCRPTMNNLTDAQQEKSMARAMVTIYGHREIAARR